jgi:molybdopterin/thiamine biosynthesis adenylyltransferase/rhodanese-related sulfurtransferase
MAVGYRKPMTSSIIDITPEQAVAMQAQGALLIDVREAVEHALGLPEHAHAIPRAELELNAASHIENLDTKVLLICGSGMRSMMAAQALSAQGYKNIFNVLGGFQRWALEKFPLETCNLDQDFTERYARHLSLPQVGIEGQKKLEQSHVVLIGAGGLGSPVAYYLAAAGVGTITIIDNDVVDKSNLQRQILHSEADIGLPKVESAAASLRGLNPRVKIQTLQQRLTSDNVHSLIANADVVIDGSDNFPTRYLLNDACVELAKPLVYAAVQRFSGQISVFDAGRHRGSEPCYCCLFPEAPNGEDAPNCAEAGVLGVLPGVMGLLQATEAIKIILNIGKSLSGRLLQFDALAMRFSEIKIPVDPQCVACKAVSRNQK